MEPGHDQVRLTLPAMPPYVRLARMAAASLASRMGFSYDHIEDLRIAVDELCFCLTGSRGRSGRIVVTYTVGPDGLRIVGDGPGAEQAVGPPALSELSRRILDAVVDEHEVTGADGRVQFHLLKRARTS